MPDRKPPIREAFLDADLARDMAEQRRKSIRLEKNAHRKSQDRLRLKSPRANGRPGR